MCYGKADRPRKFGVDLIIVILFTFFLLPTLIWGQTTPEGWLEQIEGEYNRLNYQRAENLCWEALRSGVDFDHHQLATIHKYLALALISQGKIEPGKREFRELLSYQPDYELDSLYVSPKIIDIFDEVKAQVALERLAHPPKPSPDPRLMGALRSIIMPGWGQWYKGEHLKGGVLMGLGTVTLGGVLWSHVQYQRTRDLYQNATDPDDIQSKYDRANRFYKTRNGLTAFAVGIWLFAHLDAALRPPAEPLALDARPVTFHQRISPHGVIFSAGITF
ncbi:hypothetical protein ISS37_04895 [candidate division KSB1 bacterium]|nr:hypothetical protein [candidate division KSB1 bacterium]